MTLLQSTSLATQDISSPLLVATYIADVDRELFVGLHLSGLAGNGAYRACLTRQRAGTGVLYQSPTSAVTLAAGVITAWLPTVALPVVSTDVIKVYAQGLAGDISVAIITEVFETSLRPVLAALPANIDTQLTGTHGAGSWSDATGTGPLSYSEVVEDPLGNPVDGVYVWLTTDEAGTNPVGDAYTNSLGVFTITGLDAGTYWRHIQMAGYRAPKVQVVVA